MIEKVSDSEEGSNNLFILPTIYLRGCVIFPNNVDSLFVGRPKSLCAIEKAIDDGGNIFLVCQMDEDIDDPAEGQVYEFGVVAKIVQRVKLADDTEKVLVNALYRARRVATSHQECIYSEVEKVEDVYVKSSEDSAKKRLLVKRFSTLVETSESLSDDVMVAIRDAENLGVLTDLITQRLSVKVDPKQKVLEEADVSIRVAQILFLIEGEIEILNLEAKIQHEVKSRISEDQKRYYLREKMKVIKDQLSDDNAPFDDEIAKLRDQIVKHKHNKITKEHLFKELSKLNIIPPMSPESAVIRNYLDVVCSLPWRKTKKLNSDLQAAREVLDVDHYGLQKIKKRVLQNLAVSHRVSRSKGAIVCFVGPPGVGKTSLARSIADALGRDYYRIALGGVRDDAEIRGHRKTYVGAMPGRIIRALQQVNSNNPLILFDEVDKIGVGMHGDPASALLEVLDPEQNKHFTDHFMEVPFDLSKVLFLATANSEDIPWALHDRMEIIRLDGYTEYEKVLIAERHLVKRLQSLYGVRDGEINFSKLALQNMIRYYTREAGVRQLSQKIEAIARQVVFKHHGKDNNKSLMIKATGLEKYLGVPIISDKDRLKNSSRLGAVYGLSWSKVGGDILTIEVAAYAGKGRLNITGRLGDVMQESVKAAYTVVKCHAAKIGIDITKFTEVDLHVHVPDGATPKDGPSAGVAIATAIASVLSGKKITTEVAMTGEISLQGEVMPIGGLKDKLLAAKREGIAKVFIPCANEKDLRDMDKYVYSDLQILPITKVEQVWSELIDYPI